jgi:hypothetical protein
LVLTGGQTKCAKTSRRAIKELKMAIARVGLSRMAIGFSKKREFVDLLRRHWEGRVRELRRAE